MALLTNQNLSLTQALMAPELQVGDLAGYQICKSIFAFHPLGGKIASLPIERAFAKGRDITIDSMPDVVKIQYEKVYKELDCYKVLKSAGTLSRVYGVAGIYAGQEGIDPSEPLNISTIATNPLFFNVVDPLNTSGSQSLNQNPMEPDFLKPGCLKIMGRSVHHTRLFLKNNGEEMPVFLTWSPSAFGYGGRSCYQRCLVLLKLYIKSIQTDEYILDKTGALIAKIENPEGGALSRISSAISSVKRRMIQQLRGAKVDENGDVQGGVITVGHDDSIEALNMQHVNETAEGVRKRILSNIAAAENMPATFFSDDPFATGHADGTEDKAKEAEYIDQVREDLEPMINWLDGLVMRMAWTPDFLRQVAADYPEFRENSLNGIFYRFKNAFEWEFPSVIAEPEEIQVKNNDAKITTLTNVFSTLFGSVSQASKPDVLRWYTQNVNEVLGGGELLDALEASEEQPQMGGFGGFGGDEQPPQAIEDQPQQLQQSADNVMSFADANHWITLEGSGSHVLIDGDGNVVGGAGGALDGKQLNPSSKSKDVEDHVNLTNRIATVGNRKFGHDKEDYIRESSKLASEYIKSGKMPSEYKESNQLSEIRAGNDNFVKRPKAEKDRQDLADYVTKGVAIKRDDHMSLDDMKIYNSFREGVSMLRSGTIKDDDKYDALYHSVMKTKKKILDFQNSKTSLEPTTRTESKSPNQAKSQETLKKEHSDLPKHDKGYGRDGAKLSRANPYMETERDLKSNENGLIPLQGVKNDSASLKLADKAATLFYEKINSTGTGGADFSKIISVDPVGDRVVAIDKDGNPKLFAYSQESDTFHYIANVNAREYSQEEKNEVQRARLKKKMDEMEKWDSAKINSKRANTKKTEYEALKAEYEGIGKV